MTGNRRLTPPQSRRVNSLAKKSCCNCDNGKCLLLDDGEECVCPQLISYSLLCKWFQTAVLPLDKELHAELLKGVVLYAVLPLRQAPTMRNTARTAGSVSPGNRLPSVCGKGAPLLRDRGQNSPLYKAFRARFLQWVRD